MARRRYVFITLFAAALLLMTPSGAIANESNGIGGKVSNLDAVGRSGVSIDLFEADQNGNRLNYLRSTRSDGSGAYSFDIPNGGCYSVVMIAPDGDRFASGKYRQVGTCFSRGSGTRIDGQLQSRANDKGTYRTTVVNAAGSGVKGVQVDLFRMGADNSKSGFLYSIYTQADGTYQSQLNVGCYIATGVAPAGSTFSGNKRYQNDSFCLESGRTTTGSFTLSSGANNGGGTCFRQVFRDDFNGSSLGSQWTPYNSVGNAGYGLRRPSAISVRDGKLIMTAKNNSDGVLVSGGMSLKQSQTYGRYRFRVRTDADYNKATSGVILTWPASGNQPRDGENNMYETGWGDPSRKPFFSYIHEPFQDTNRPTQQAWLPHYADGTQWQIMTMEWTPDQIRIVREGPGDQNWKEYVVKERSDDNVIPDVDHFVAIQLDNWKHSSSNTVRMEVDWIEVSEYCG